jgi:MoaA/NifB/PqqE/SkfB family radical SAM enzyme
MTSKNISFQLNQFSQADELISTVQGEAIGPTVSLCHQCYQHIPAYRYHKDNQLWMVKECRVHGISHHMIERDYMFVNQLTYGKDLNGDHTVLIEVSDRCNVDCPHCYHIPDNTIPDKPIEEIIKQIEAFYQPGMDICLTGAEASLRKDFPQLISALIKNFDDIIVSTLTNGIRFADKDFLKQCIDAGLHKVRLGLNHPGYLDNTTIRQKQIQSIYNLKDLGKIMNYIGYTMASISELEDILAETTNNNWTPAMYRIRYGSDIGRYPDQQRMYVSDIFKITKSWCAKHGKKFSIMEQADNNIYHVMVKIDNVPYRLIQWCDETDIDLEELRCGPWCDFVPADGITNFLHQIIRRDVWKNKGITVSDLPPARYLYNNAKSKTPLIFNELQPVKS